jgi:phenylpropionate dioxygenase-like ring-hydroxylating dioxygenase large terminal subunit
MTLRSAAYTDPKWLDLDVRAVLARTWQWVCHVEKLRAPGSYVAATVAGQPIVVVRNKTGHQEAGELRAFYNVCKHRAHELLSGSGTTGTIVCPYHAWVYDLDGSLRNARHTAGLTGFDKGQICLDRVRVEESGGFVHVNLDPAAAPLGEQAPDLAADIARWAPDVAGLTFAKRLIYDIRSNGRTSSCAPTASGPATSPTPATRTTRPTTSPAPRSPSMRNGGCGRTRLVGTRRPPLARPAPARL